MPSRRARPIVPIATSLAALLTLAAPAAAQEAVAPQPAGGPRYINPPGLTRPSGYTHVVVSSDGRTVYVAGQVAFDSAGQVVGPGDFRAQAAQVFSNLGRALASVGATFGDVMKTTTYITDVRNLGMLREARARYFDAARAPANTLIPVSALARPELLLEIEAVAEIRPAGR
ncbi:MAG TPA: RidA family protein [Gemmatimonadales bacterium]|nr:RidA family protein [Gemmatimonadales bacterium]